MHLEASIHQDVHVGSAADQSFLTPSLWSWRQEQAAGRGQSGVWWRLSCGFLSANTHTQTVSCMEDGNKHQSDLLCIDVSLCVCTGLSW